MKPTLHPSMKRAALIAGGSALALMAAVGSASALTDAGQRIQNQATATYKDALGNDYTSQSNLASVQVTQVYFATLENDKNVVVASNQTAYFQHYLTNTGNGDDTYTLTVANDVAGRTDSGDFSTLEVYIDANENGVVDAGEVLATNVTLAAGESVSLVVAGLVPTAANGATFDATLTATSANGTVTDLTDSKGVDGLDGTNENRATVSGDAVLNVVKSSVHDEDANTIVYSIVVTNTGNAAAKDVVIFDGIPSGTTLVGASITGSGFGTTIDANDVDAVAGNLDETVLGLDLNGDGDTTDADESALGLDLNSNGQNDAAPAGVYGFDDLLPPGTTIEVNFTVSYDPAALGAGTEIENIAYVAADLDDDPGTPDGTVPSTRVTDEVAQVYNVDVADTGAGADLGVNDGGDDDDTLNNTQLVDTAQSGELVLFTHTIENTGNGTDTFELSVANVSGFPAGTSFTIWNETGTVQLLNTNGVGGVDTGPMASGDTRTLLIRAQLPPNGTSVAASTYDLVAVSADDPSTNPATDSTIGELSQIVAPTVDLSNTASDGNGGVNADSYNNDGVPITTAEVNLGDTASFDLFIQNDSQVADSFQLASGGSFNSVAGTLGGLPSGWSVVFRDSGGSVITTTPSIASGGTFAFTAEVTVPSVESLALADRTFVIDSAGSDRVDQNGDGDGDYGIFFRVTSVNSGASDVKLDAVDVLPREQITLLQDNAGQIQPGGSIDYPHTLQNDGNTSERVTLSAANGTTNWSNNLLVDTTGDGTPDTPFGSLVDGSTLYVTDASGNPKAVTLDANLTFPLEPGESTNVVVRVFAPTSAPNGQLDITTLTATFNGGTGTVTNVDRSEVVEAQLRLTKTASVDATCAGAAAADLGPDVAFAPTANQAAPADCVVWQVVARNAGVDVITNVEITDAVPAFSAYRAGTLRICAGDAGTAAAAACSFSTLTDGPTDDEGAYSAGDVTFTLGGGATPALTLNQLASGESVTVRFSTEVE